MSEQTLHTPLTPLPWNWVRCENPPDGGPNGGICIWTENQAYLEEDASPYRGSIINDGDAMEMHDEDAQYIVEACNSHYTLLETNKRKDALLARGINACDALSNEFLQRRDPNQPALQAVEKLRKEMEAGIAGTPLPLPSERDWYLYEALAAIQTGNCNAWMRFHKITPTEEQERDFDGDDAPLYRFVAACALLTKKDGGEDA
jgi:hypothetical protein